MGFAEYTYRYEGTLKTIGKRCAAALRYVGGPCFVLRVSLIQESPMPRVSSGSYRRSLASIGRMLGLLIVVSVARPGELRAQSSSSGEQPVASRSSSHRVRTAGIVGAGLGLTAGVTGAYMLGASDSGEWARG